MTDQTNFFDGYDIRSPGVFTRRDELDKKFAEFHEANQHVWRLFVRFTFDVMRRGFKNYSARAVVHRIRWHTDVDTSGPDEFKINNNYTPAYSRLFHETYPEHDGFFRTRERVSGQAAPRGTS